MDGQKPYVPRADSDPAATISSSIACASSYSSRATGCSRIFGNFPRSSQARKKNCQSISSRSSASAGLTARTPVNAGVGRSANDTTSRLATARENGSSG